MLTTPNSKPPHNVLLPTAHPVHQSAPPVYRPLPAPRVQLKTVQATAPPVYRPITAPQVQLKTVPAQAPPVYRPPAAPRVQLKAVQAKAESVLSTHITKSSDSFATDLPNGSGFHRKGVGEMSIPRAADIRHHFAQRRHERPNSMPVPAPVGRTVQRITAYRVDDTGLKPKRQPFFEWEDDGKSMNISFGGHEDYFYNKRLNENIRKHKDNGVVVATWDFPDDLYQAVVAKMRGKPDDIPSSRKNEVKKLGNPTNSSDKYVRENNLIAPSLPPDWIEVVNKACARKPVTFTRFSNLVKGKSYANNTPEPDLLTWEEFQINNMEEAGYAFRPY